MRTRREILGTCLTFILVGMTLNLFIPAKPYSILTSRSNLHVPSTVLERTRFFEYKEGKGSTWGSSPDPSTTSLTEATADNITGFVSPDSSYHAITSEIQKADDSIYILMYEFYHPELYASLEAAVLRGVSLTIVLENDTGYRTSGEGKDKYNRYYAYKFYNLSQGYDVEVYLEREWRYLHAKLVVIDNSTAIVMSANMDPGSIPANLGGEATEYETFSRQWGCIIHGSDACEQYVRVVENEIRYHATPYNPMLDGTGEEPELNELVSYSPIFTTTSRTDVPFTPVFSPNNSFECLNESIYAADHYILLQLMYLSWGAYSSNKVNQLVFALEDAVERNVTVMVMLEEDMEAYYTESKVELESRGIHVLPANSTSGFPLFIHNKGVIIDDRLVFVGSVNWSDYSIDNNRETGALVDSPGIARWFKDVLEVDWDATGEVFDADDDGLPSLFEEEHGFDPNDEDSDDDGETDYEEVFSFDTTRPTITITAPSPDTVFNTSDVTVTWEGYDTGSGIHHYEVRLDNNTWIPVARETSHKFTNLSNGEHTVEVKAVDRVGNTASDVIHFTVNISLIGGPGFIEEVVLVLVILAMVIFVLLIKKKD